MQINSPKPSLRRVKRIYGIVGDSLNGLTDAVRRHGKIEWVHVRHEEDRHGAFGAMAYTAGTFEAQAIANLAELVATFCAAALLLVVVILGSLARIVG